MFRFLFGLLVGCAIGFLGYIGGSLFPAPPELLTRLHAQSVADRVQADLSNVDWQTLRGSLGEQRFAALSQRASRLAAAAGNAVIIEHSDDVDTSEQQAASMTPISFTPAPAARPSGAAPATTPSTPAPGGFESTLALCPGMTITNSPPADATRRVTNYTPIVNVNGIALAIDPTHQTCLSSGFGPRGSSMHKGIDFYSPNGGVISAAADGTIIEMKYRDDYGNMLLIDHGHGVYTRYAHLSAFQRGLAVGSQVHAGDQIGLMGNTASYPLPIHLHYELLLGDYNNPKGSFGLTPHSPFDYHG